MKFLDDQALARLRNSADEPDLVGTRYRLLGRVARGGMGVVYSAEDTSLQRKVALKVLDSASSNPDLSKRLTREARVLAQLEHPGIVPVHDVGELPDGRVFYAMKFVEGQRLEEFATSLATLPDKLRLFLRICDAVAFAHARGVLHRDLKPANIMVGSFGEVLVMDWGLAKILRDPPPGEETVFSVPPTASSGSGATESTEVTGHGTVMGTPGFMSPEQERGEVNALDVRSDIFSLGAVLRFLVGGKNQEINSEIPKPLRAILQKSTANEKGQRYASVAELSQDISRFLDGLAVSAYRESFLERAARFYKRHQIAILLISAYLVMRALLILFSRH